VRLAESRGVQVEGSFQHFDPNNAGYVDADGLRDGLAKLGIGVSDAAADILVSQVGRRSSLHFTSDDLRMFVHEEEVEERVLASLDGGLAAAGMEDSRAQTAGTGTGTPSRSSRRKSRLQGGGQGGGQRSGWEADGEGEGEGGVNYEQEAQAHLDHLYEERSLAISNQGLARSAMDQHAISQKLGPLSPSPMNRTAENLDDLERHTLINSVNYFEYRDSGQGSPTDASRQGEEDSYFNEGGDRKPRPGTGSREGVRGRRCTGALAGLW